MFSIALACWVLIALSMVSVWCPLLMHSIEVIQCTLNPFTLFCVLQRTVVGIQDELLLCSIGDLPMHLWRMLQFLWLQVVVFEQQFVNVVVHGEVAYLLCVVQYNIDACKFGLLPVCGDSEILLQCNAQMLCMALFNILESKIVNNEDKCYWPPFVLP